MAKNSKYSRQTSTAEYGQALMCNRGGWTLREMLGTDYKSNHEEDNGTFTQKDFQRSLEKAARRVRPSVTGPKKK